MAKLLARRTVADIAAELDYTPAEVNTIIAARLKPIISDLLSNSDPDQINLTLQSPFLRTLVEMASKAENSLLPYVHAKKIEGKVEIGGMLEALLDAEDDEYNNSGTAE